MVLDKGYELRNTHPTRAMIMTSNIIVVGSKHQIRQGVDLYTILPAKEGNDTVDGNLDNALPVLQIRNE